MLPILTDAAEAAKDNLVLPDDASFQTAPPIRLGYVKPRDILHLAALFTEEVMVPPDVRLEKLSLAVGRDFVHQAGAPQDAQIVVYRSPGSPRVTAVHFRENLVR